MKQTMFPQAQVLKRRKQGDLALPTGEIIEVKTIPFSGATFVTGGESEPRYRTIVVVADGPSRDWYVLGEIAIGNWVRGRPDNGRVVSWYAPLPRAIGCVREWGCAH